MHWYLWRLFGLFKLIFPGLYPYASGLDGWHVSCTPSHDLPFAFKIPQHFISLLNWYYSADLRIFPRRPTGGGGEGRPVPNTAHAHVPAGAIVAVPWDMSFCVTPDLLLPRHPVGPSTPSSSPVLRASWCDETESLAPYKKRSLHCAVPSCVYVTWSAVVPLLCDSMHSGIWQCIYTCSVCCHQVSRGHYLHLP